MSHDPADSPSILRRAYDGATVVGGCAVSSVKALGKLGIRGTKALGGVTGDMLHSASLATGLHRMIDPPIPLSPAYRAKKLNEYRKSYDLEAFQRYAKETAKKLGTIHYIPTEINPDGTRTVDLFKLGGIGASIGAHVNANAGDKAKVGVVTTALGDISPEHILTGPNSLQGKFLALHDEIEKNSDGYSDPAQVIAAFEELQQRTLTDLAKSKNEAIQKLRDTLVPKDAPEPLTPAQTDFADLCDINPPGDKNKIAAKVDLIIKHVQEEYEKAEKSVREYFDGTPEQKDVPGVPGLTSKLQNEKEVAEADLLLRINHLERMMKRDFKIKELAPDVSDLQGQNREDEDEADDKEFRARCLHKVTLERLRQETWEGKYWGQKQVNTVHTRNGFEYVCDNNGKVTGLKIPPQWFLTDAQWQQKVQLALEDYISALKIDMKPGEKLSLTINHPVDSNRAMTIEAAYRAALKNGYKLDDIEFIVTGGKEEKQIFNKKTPAKDVLAAYGLSATDPTLEADMKNFKGEKKKISDNQAQAAQKNIKTRITALQLNPNTAKDINKALEEAAPPPTPGIGG